TLCKVTIIGGSFFLISFLLRLSSANIADAGIRKITKIKKANITVNKIATSMFSTARENR
ncbi:MAG: hypothetical protein WB587_04955, partial [Nitrososphaeraceae archaeon]